ncbi:MAG: formate dehydrogenase subunit delta [Sphingomonadaceae bacterium]
MDIRHLTYMANQIARNLLSQGEDQASELTFQHLRDFWDPRMKAAIVNGDRSGLDPIASAAVDRLAGSVVTN